MVGKSHSVNIRRYPNREVWMTEKEYLGQKKYYDNNKIPSDGDSIIIRLKNVKKVLKEWNVVYDLQGEISKVEVWTS